MTKKTDAVFQNSKFKFNIRYSIFSPGIGRSLLLFLLIAALLPMTIVSWIHYQDSKEILVERSSKHLQEVIASEADQFTRYFNRIIANLTMLSELEANISFLQELKKGFAASNRELGEFIRGYGWSVSAEQGGDLSLFRRTFGVHDIFLIDTDGNILFSVAEEDDLGVNLFTGPLADTGFSKACRVTNETGKMQFADYDRYAITDDETPFAFMSAPMIDEYGERIGIMAFQLIGYEIDAMLGTSLGESGEVFFISQGGKRSTCKLDPDRKFLDPIEETEQTRLWQQRLASPDVDPEDPLRVDEKVTAYAGHLGNQVLGLHRPIQVLDTPFALIAEVDQQQALALVNNLRWTVIKLALFTALMAFILMVFYARTLVGPILQLVERTKMVAAGDYNQQIDIKAKYELAQLADNFKTMQASLKKTMEREKQDNWQKSGLAGLNDTVRGEQELVELAGGVMSYLANYLRAQVGAFYLHEEESFVYCAGYACKLRGDAGARYAAGEGLIGQAGHEKKSIHYTDLPEEHLALTVNSGLSESAPAAILAIPLLYEGQVLGVFELGRISTFTAGEIHFLEEVASSIAIALNTSLIRNRTNELLFKTQQQSHELQRQQEELKSSNEELEEQTSELQKSKQLMQEQSEELKASNEELEEKTESLQRQKIEIAQAKDKVEQKARELASSSRYKSEFLANMSHELRSPLNSLLILARSLADNDEGNLTSEQVEEADIIHNSGTELLHLINDILDLSKVEAGQLDIHEDTISIEPFCQSLAASYTALAADKGLDFRVETNSALPALMVSDEQRLGQILKNLISNALKFTTEGEVVLAVEPKDDDTIAFAVRDTGIGIPPEKQLAIFEAFQQADGSTTRQYGGTGLGLTISRKLAELLGGAIEVESEAGQGATFTVKLPGGMLNVEDECRMLKVEGEQETTRHDSDASNFKIQFQDSTFNILIVDDDMRNTFAIGNLLKKAGLTVVMAADGLQALKRVEENPDIDLILMDMMMPNMDGYEATAKIRAMDEYKDLPIIALTAKAMGEDRRKCLDAGANDYLAKPVEKEPLLEMMGRMLNVEC